LLVLSCLVTVSERSVVSAGPKLWNSLPDDITSALSLTVAKAENTFISAVTSGHYYVAFVCGYSRHGGPSSYLLWPP